MSKDLAARIPIPAKNSINTGLHSPLNSQVKAALGPPTPPGVSNRLVTETVGPFRCTGDKKFVQTLRRIFAKVKRERPDLYEQVKTAGCYNMRLQRGSSKAMSNHSWGIAIDLYFGAAVTPRGSGQTEQGLLDLYAYFHAENLYWGAEFKADDGMHFEASQEWLTQHYS